MENDSSKLILITALKTAVIIILAVALIILFLGVVSPKTLADVCYDVGFNQLALSYSRSAYRNSNDVNDLATLVERAIETDTYDTVAEYGKILIEDGSFADYCRFRDEQNGEVFTGNVTLSFERYVKGNTCLALAKTGEVDEALGLCTEYLQATEDSFRSITAYFILADSEIKANATTSNAYLEKANAVKGALETAKAGAEGTQKQKIEEFIFSIQAETESVKEWLTVE